MFIRLGQSLAGSQDIVPPLAAEKRFDQAAFAAMTQVVIDRRISAKVVVDLIDEKV